MEDLSWLEEYDAVAQWCASRGLKGHEGDRLPELVSERCKKEIEADPEAFRERIRATAYMLAMEGRE